MQTAETPLDIFLNMNVKQIDSQKDRVILSLGNGSKYKAKAAYVTAGWQHIDMPGIKNDVAQLLQIGISYSNGTPEQGVEVFDALKEYLAKDGIEVEGNVPLAQRLVNYHPRFTPEAIANGAFRIIEENQGVGNIFFGGAAITFELTEAVAAHSKRMAPKVSGFLKGINRRASLL